MANLTTRVQRLEATASQSKVLFCRVVHKKDCAEERAKAIADFVAEQGHEPHDFIDILLISPETKRSICGCASGDVGFSSTPA